MRPATKHYLFFAFLLASLAALVAFVLWQWSRLEDEAADGPPARPGRQGPAGDGRTAPSESGGPGVTGPFRPSLAPAAATP
jgi:hypothetical protein